MSLPIIPLILFFISLAGIIVMVFRELMLIRRGHVMAVEHSHPLDIEFQKIKFLFYRGVKKTSLVVLFIILKIFIKTSNSIKTKTLAIARMIAKKIKKNGDEILEKKEVSKYLKIISEYRYRIQQMKHRIKEEEGIQ